MLAPGIWPRYSLSVRGLCTRVPKRRGPLHSLNLVLMGGRRWSVPSIKPTVEVGQILPLALTSFLVYVSQPQGSVLLLHFLGLLFYK